MCGQGKQKGRKESMALTCLYNPVPAVQMFVAWIGRPETENCI